MPLRAACLAGWLGAIVGIAAFGYRQVVWPSRGAFPPEELRCPGNAARVVIFDGPTPTVRCEERE